ADTIRKTVKNELNLTLSAGVSFNKIFAKMGSDYKKPDATTVITKNNFKNILWPLNVRSMFFVGKATAEKLKKSGITTIGELAVSDKSMLCSLLGKQGELIHDYANGLDFTPVSKYDELEKIKSIGNGTTFRRNLINSEDIKTAVISLSDTVATRLRKHKLKAFGVKVDIKNTNLKVISRQQQLENPTNLAETISDTALGIIKKSWKLREPIRMLTVTAINLCNENQAMQLSLFSSEDVFSEKGEKIERTMDDIREKFGNSAITFGRIIGNDIGVDSKNPLIKDENNIR
ncbi:MAG: DNA polymerase IV, partial [Anaerovoracaceae bacterium]